MGILWILFQITNTIQTLLVAQLHTAQVQYGVLHRASHLLATASFLTVHEGSQNTNRQVHTSITVAQSSSRYGRRTIPETGGGGCAASTLGYVLIHF